MPGLGAAIEWLRAGFGRLAPASALAAEPNTAGGDAHAHEDPAWDGGWWRGARRQPAHPGRVGGAIKPWAVVIHTTDMAPETWAGLQRRLQREAGRGAGAHFWIGRDPAQGVIQSVPCNRNAQHAGGPGGKHGWLLVGEKREHPNLEAIGIEVHCAGALIQRGGLWYAIDRSRDLDGDGDLDAGPTGAPIPTADVEVDPKRPGHGWHRPSEYQLGELALLLASIAEYPGRAPAPAKWGVLGHVGDDRVSGEPVYGTPTNAWAPRVLIGGVPVVGHVTLDERRKGDPWPPLSRWLQGWSG